MTKPSLALSLLASILLATNAAPLPDPPAPAASPKQPFIPGTKIIPQPLREKLFDANGHLQSILSNPPGAKLPETTIPEVQVEKAKIYSGTTRKKIRYGPYRLPGTGEDNWQKSVNKLAGMADEYVHYHDDGNDTS
jgi:hypothetical protein